MTEREEDDLVDAGTVVVECELDAPPEKVWRALTVPELVAEWLEAAPSGRRHETHYEIIEATPFTRLRYAWHDDATHQDSFVTFELWRRENGSTGFRLTHSVGAKPVAANGNSPPMAIAA